MKTLTLFVSIVSAGLLFALPGLAKTETPLMMVSYSECSNTLAPTELRKQAAKNSTISAANRKDYGAGYIAPTQTSWSYEDCFSSSFDGKGIRVKYVIEKTHDLSHLEE